MTDEKRKGHGAHPIKDGIVSAIRSCGNVYTAAVDTVSLAVQNALLAAKRAGSSSVGAITYVALGAIRGALEFGSDLGEACKGIMVGVLLGTRDRGDAAFRTISHTARTVIHHTANTGSDVVAATEGLVRGAIQIAKDSQEDTTAAASAAAQGALEGADEVGFAAAEQVRMALKAPFQGGRILLLPPYQQQDR
jgi:hypothetical protein